MDFWFNKNPRIEREFQQLVQRENNRSSISGETEYFITDIEIAASDIGAKFDMIAIKWVAKKTKNGKNCRASFIEMKYGDAALSGNSGLIKHIKDMNTFLTVKENYFAILETMTTQFNQLDELGLVKFNKSTSNAKVKLNVDERPEVIFILANHNPRSSKLRTILSDPEIDKYAQSQLFDLKFYVASFAGYGLHAKCMQPLSEFRRLL